MEFNANQFSKTDFIGNNTEGGFAQAGILGLDLKDQFRVLG